MIQTFNLTLGPPERKYCVHKTQTQHITSTSNLPVFKAFTFSYHVCRTVNFAGLVRSVDKELSDVIMHSVPNVVCPLVIGGLELHGMTGLLCHLYWIGALLTHAGIVDVSLLCAAVCQVRH